MTDKAIPVDAYTYVVCGCGQVSRVAISELARDSQHGDNPPVRNRDGQYMVCAMVKCPGCGRPVCIELEDITSNGIVRGDIPLTFDEVKR